MNRTQTSAVQDARFNAPKPWHPETLADIDAVNVRELPVDILSGYLPEWSVPRKRYASHSDGQMRERMKEMFLQIPSIGFTITADSGMLICREREATEVPA